MFFFFNQSRAHRNRFAFFFELLFVMEKNMRRSCFHSHATTAWESLFRVLVASFSHQPLCFSLFARTSSLPLTALFLIVCTFVLWFSPHTLSRFAHQMTYSFGSPVAPLCRFDQSHFLLCAFIAAPGAARCSRTRRRSPCCRRGGSTCAGPPRSACRST
jgi:hypothetical protein